MDDLLSKPYNLEQCAQLLGRWSARPSAPAPTLPEPLAHVDAATVAGLRQLRRDGQGDLYAKLVELFAASSAQALTQLCAALERADLAAAAAVCHKLGASAANVGASVYARDVRALERLCTTGEVAEARQLYARLAAARAALLAELCAVRLQASA